MASYNGLMQRRRVGMISVRVVPVWVFARVEEQPYDIGVPVLRGDRERSVPALSVRRRQQLPGICRATRSIRPETSSRSSR